VLNRIRLARVPGRASPGPMTEPVDARPMLLFLKTSAAGRAIELARRKGPGPDRIRTPVWCALVRPGVRREVSG